MTQHRTTPLDPMSLALQAATADAPEWVHLLPTARGSISTDDARGPYVIDDADAIIAASFAQSDRLPIDQDHATDLAAPKGLPAPARGWIVAMEARTDGIWGRVEWTGEGARLLADRAYRAISPVILHDKAKRVFAVLRASLVNRPNLKGLVALNSSQEDIPMNKIAEALGLSADATEGDIIAAIGKLNEGSVADPAMQASLQASNAAVADLTARVAELSTALQARDDADKKTRAEACVDAAIVAKRAGINATTREHYISLHLANPAQAEAIISGLPKLGPTGMTVEPPAAMKEGEVSLNASDSEAARLLGIPADKMLETRKKEAR